MRFSSLPIGKTTATASPALFVSGETDRAGATPIFIKKRRQQPDRLAEDRGARAECLREYALLYA